MNIFIRVYTRVQGAMFCQPRLSLLANGGGNVCDQWNATGQCHCSGSFVCLMGCNSLHSCTIFVIIIYIYLQEMYMCRILPFICAFALVIQPILGYDRALYDTGSTVYLEITFHEFDRLYFVDQRDIMLGNIQEATVGAQDPIGYRDMETSPNTAGPLGYQARLLFDFAKRDSTPASLLASTLRNSPEDVFPPSEVRIVIFMVIWHGFV
jgi:hypothetical protein